MIAHIDFCGTADNCVLESAGGTIFSCVLYIHFSILWKKGIREMSDYLLLAASVDCLSDKILYDKAFELVSEARRKKADSYRLEEDRRRSLAAGVLLNQAVRLWSNRTFSGMCGHSENENDNIIGSENISGGEGLHFIDLKTAIEVYDSKFDYSMGTMANGKPVFLEHPEVHFNLSHAGNYVVCVISHREVGVDVEGNRAVRASIENRFFSEEECRWVQAADSEKLHSERFFRLWTLKEAYSKLTGEGISYGIGKAHFEVPLVEISEENLSGKPEEKPKQCPKGKNLERGADFYEYVIGDGYSTAAEYEAGKKYYVAVAVESWI